MASAVVALAFWWPKAPATEPVRPPADPHFKKAASSGYARFARPAGARGPKGQPAGGRFRRRRAKSEPAWATSSRML